MLKIEPLEVPWGRTVTYSLARVPREVPPEIAQYFEDGCVYDVVPVVEFDGDKYHILEKEPAPPGFWQAMNMETGDIIVLDFTKAPPRQEQKNERTD